MAVTMPVNWGFAETLAYGTLLEAGHPIRFTGQDVGRGTFSHRHAIVHDQKTGESYNSLCHMAEDQPRCEMYDSFLSEEAVLAFGTAMPPRIRKPSWFGKRSLAISQTALRW